MVLTVLSGTVEVCGGNGPQIVHATRRSVVAPNKATVAAMPNTEYTQQWLGEPGSRTVPTILYSLPVALSMLHSLWAMDGQDHEPRHVTDFVGSLPRVILRVDGDVALINVGSLIHAHFGGGIGSAGRPLVGSPDRDAGQEREFGLFVIDMESTEVTKMLDGAPFSKTPGQCCPPSARTAPSWRIGKSATRTIRFISFVPKRTSAADSTHGTRSRPLSR